MGHDEVVRLLLNWSRWAASWFPDLQPQQPPAFELWRPYNDPDFKLWGDAIPEAVPEINEADADRVDKALCPTKTRVAIEHVLTLKRHYINFKRQPRDKLDAAIRALGDVL